MPRRRNTAYRARKRRYNRRRRYYKKKGGAVTTFKRNVKIGKGFPSRLVFTHKYAQTFPMTGTTGGTDTFYMSCNSLYDPDQITTGHQPQGFDTLAALYNHYHVIGARCKFFITPTAAAEEPANIAAWIGDDTSAVSQNVIYQAEQSNFGTYRMIPANSTTSIRPIILKWSAKREHGNVLANIDLRGTSSASPTEQSYFMIAVASCNGTSTVEVLVTAYIEFIAVWTELKDIPGN